MKQSYKVIRTEHPGNVWTLPVELMQRFGLKENDLVRLKCGSATSGARLCQDQSLAQGKASRMGLSPGLLKDLHLPEGIFLLIKPAGNREFRLGPLIGILTFPGHLPGRLGYYRCYARRNLKNGLLYVFRGRYVNPQHRTVTGYHYNQAENKWKLGEFPYPDAVIDRCYPNAYICHLLLEKIIGRQRIFNKKTMINKVDFCKALDADPFLRKYIPETRLLGSGSDLAHFLRKYREVFLKPVTGMKGFGIIAVKTNDQGLLECLYTIKGRHFTRTISSAGEIFSVLESAAGYRRQYIMQQAVPRMEYQGGPFSFRTWAMKNGQGRWVMPGLFAKGSLGQGFLTNFTAGAKLVPLQALFKDIIPRLPYTKENLLKLLEELTLRTAAALDKKYGPLGELGLDIVFDTGGKPWVIEANGNPGNIPIFIQTEYPAWRRLVFQYPLDYATYLAGF